MNNDPYYENKNFGGMKMLKKYLMEKFQISTLELIDCRINCKFTVAELIEVVKKRGTEQKFVDIIENFKFSTKKDVIMYLAGVADSFPLEAAI